MTRRRRPRQLRLRGHAEPVRNVVAAVYPSLLHAPQTGMVERRRERPAELKLAGHPSSVGGDNANAGQRFTVAAVPRSRHGHRRS